MAIIYISLGALYHTKDYQGTTTDHDQQRLHHAIIPYQGLPGNCNLSRYIVEGVSLGSVKG